MTQTAIRFLRDGDKNPLLPNRELSIPQAFTDMVKATLLSSGAASGGGDCGTRPSRGTWHFLLPSRHPGQGAIQLHLLAQKLPQDRRILAPLRFRDLYLDLTLSALQMSPPQSLNSFFQELRGKFLVLLHEGGGQPALVGFRQREGEGVGAGFGQIGLKQRLQQAFRG